ncbi:hypothetical protein HC248_02624 [Polaromonas vacuolata]|uniref:Pilus assembly protein n=1 Tax=Polaromonas vacuolata TaxID=37448 RepID=A0A6H2HBY4_9BURK|nr:DUF1028 domain-containing protein [Polaromonas vacuolata]QJC57303.1 hypothetical protein HC248_02624 [Polaromonas vacuolata]
MTWSIVARDTNGDLGVAVASRFFAVGALCPFGQSHVGALATQALVNPLLAAPSLSAMADGRDPAEILRTLLALDAGIAQRQIHLVDALGRGAAHTGAECVDWCGHSLHNGFSVAGNMLAGPEVIAATAQSYKHNNALPFALRLILAMQAGQTAGGDKRGKQAAALLIYSGQDYPALDIRIDDHTEPLDELLRLYRVSLERYLPFSQCLATRENPSGIIDRTEIDAHIARFHAAQKSPEPQA